MLCVCAGVRGNLQAICNTSCTKKKTLFCERKFLNFQTQYITSYEWNHTKENEEIINYYFLTPSVMTYVKLLFDKESGIPKDHRWKLFKKIHKKVKKSPTLFGVIYPSKVTFMYIKINFFT